MNESPSSELASDALTRKEKSSPLSALSAIPESASKTGASLIDTESPLMPSALSASLEAEKETN